MVALSPIVPQRCYRNARPALDFLARAFGFTPELIVPDDGDAIAHAEVWVGTGCLMLASIPADARWHYRVPNEIGGVNTGAPYLATAEIDALYARAKNAGCTIVSELADTDYGSRDFSASDLEGFLWHFGTYRPLDAQQTSSETSVRREPELFAGMRYTDAPAAIRWLERAFGAVAGFVVPGPADTIAHAQLLIGDGLFMLGTGADDIFAMKTPAQIGDAYTQTLNVFVADPDRHHAVARSAGAQILAAPADTPYGARGYVVRDPEGYVWNFTTYVPTPPAAKSPPIPTR